MLLTPSIFVHITYPNENSKDKIDPALLRPGRLEKHVYIGYADSDEEWSELFSRVALSRDLDPDILNFISSGELLRQHGGCMKHLRRLSAADLKAVMDTAHLAAVHNYLDRGKGVTVSNVGFGVGGSETRQVTIEARHIIDALRSSRPSLSDDDKRMLASIYAPFYSDGDGGGGGGVAPNMPPLGDFGRPASNGDIVASSYEQGVTGARQPLPVLRTTLR